MRARIPKLSNLVALIWLLAKTLSNAQAKWKIITRADFQSTRKILKKTQC
jgi:hypothetical protein